MCTLIIHPHRRLHWPPSKALIKKYIRSTAVRYGHAGMPWLLHDDLLARYRIEKHLDPEMAERVRRIRMLKRANMERLTKEQQQQQHTSMITDKQEDSLKYPVLDEFVPADKQTDIELWPIPKSFDSSLSVIRDELMTEVLELWHFLHAFGHTLEVAPMCLHVFISSLEHEGEENPVMDALVGAFRDEFTRTVRSARVREERTEQYLGTCAPSDLPPFARPPLSPHLSIPDESDLEAFVEASLRKDPRHWSSQMLELLWDLRSIPEVRLSILTMKEKRKKIFELDGACKLRILLILRNFYLSCVSLRPTVDKEIEIAADAKHKIRELEAIRKKLYDFPIIINLTPPYVVQRRIKT